MFNIINISWLGSCVSSKLKCYTIFQIKLLRKLQCYCIHKGETLVLLLFVTYSVQRMSQYLFDKLYHVYVLFTGSFCLLWLKGPLLESI